MNRVLIVYGTSEGQTRKVCAAMASALEAHGVQVDVVEARTSNPDPAPYDGIIVAGSVHVGRYQRSLIKWVRTRAAEFGDRPTAFVSVCLAVAGAARNPKVVDELDAIVQRFCDITGWWPGRVTHVAGALLYTQYNVFTRWIMKRIAAAAGGDTDVSKDYEYTDWNAVRGFAVEFGRRLRIAA